MVPKVWSLEPRWGSLGHLGALTVFPCFSADLISSFLLIAMLFFISVSLLVGVVKVRALSGRGRGTRTSGAPAALLHPS